MKTLLLMGITRERDRAFGDHFKGGHAYSKWRLKVKLIGIREPFFLLMNINIQIRRISFLFVILPLSSLTRVAALIFLAT